MQAEAEGGSTGNKGKKAAVNEVGLNVTGKKTPKNDEHGEERGLGEKVSESQSKEHVM